MKLQKPKRTESTSGDKVVGYIKIPKSEMKNIEQILQELLGTKVMKATQEQLRNPKIAKGRCYECAFEYLAKVSKTEAHRYRLAHGERIHEFQDGKKLQFDHAWVEKDGNIVLEMQNDLRKKPLEFPKETYYSKHQVLEGTVKKYTQAEMWDVGAKEGGHYGPWGRGFRFVRG